MTSSALRSDQRTPHELRSVEFQRNYLQHSLGSVLVNCGGTRIICAASLAAQVPRFLRGKGLGWVTAEYSMLPCATHTRQLREVMQGRQQGRSMEIQRLIGRSLRAAVDLRALGERSIIIDCDVIQADGGTRTASITGGYIALYDFLSSLVKQGVLLKHPIRTAVAAVSVGSVGGQLLCDLDYEEDSQAEFDLNIVINEQGALLEIQGTAERSSLELSRFNQLLLMGQTAALQLIAQQKKLLA